jgi:glycosyltransferase involved in cell wall biosynthesis
MPLPILVVNSALYIGGAERVAACLTHGLDPKRFSVAVCLLKGRGEIADQLVQNGVEVLTLPRSTRGQRDYFTSLKLARLLRRRGTRVIHTHDTHGLIDGSICRALIPNLRHVHTFHFGNYPHQRALYRLLERAVWRMPDALVAVGHHQAQLISTCHKIPLDRMRVIWNGVDDPASIMTLELLGGVAPNGVPVIASISTLTPQKGLEDLLKAAALLRDLGERFVLVIVGGGPLEHSLRADAQRLNLSDLVRFIGWVPQASTRVLPVCDIFVQSSRWEAMSIVVLEAMAAGKPIVVTRVGENPRVVIDGTTGLTVPPSDPQALASALRRLLRDRELRQQFGASARRRYEGIFTTQHMIRAYEDLYIELCRDRTADSCSEISTRGPRERTSRQSEV